MLKKIEGFNHYYISDDGRVFSDARGGELRERATRLNQKGYKYTFLTNGKNVKKTAIIHRLVAEYFLPNYDKNLQVNHIDGDKTNNKVENLEMVTGLENMRHASEHHLLKNVCGEKHYKTTLTNEDVIEIRKKYMPKVYTMKMLADEYNVTKKSISAIINRRTWKHL